MEFKDIREMIERFLPIYLRARNIEYKLSFPNDKTVKLTARYEDKRYIIKAYEKPLN